jgi:hypothetical protein
MTRDGLPRDLSSSKNHPVTGAQRNRLVASTLVGRGGRLSDAASVVSYLA